MVQQVTGRKQDNLRRPVVGAFLAFAGGVGFEYYFEINGCLMLMPAFACALLCVSVPRCRCRADADGITNRGLKNFMLFVALFLMLFFLGSFSLWHTGRAIEAPLASKEMPAVVEGRIISVERKDVDFYKLQLRICEVAEAASTCVSENSVDSEDSVREYESYPYSAEKNEHIKNKKVIVNLYEDISEMEQLRNYGDIVGRNVVLSGILSRPQGRRNPRTFDYSLYLKSRGISINMVCDAGGVQLTDGRVNLIANTISVFKCNLMREIEESMADSELAGLAIGMLLGDKTEIEDETYENFQRNGTAHILAISGLHIGAIYFCVNSCVKARVFTQTLYPLRNVRQKKKKHDKQKTNRWIPQIIIMTILVGYAALTGFAPSVVRAVCMILLHIFSKLLYRRYDMLTAASLIAFFVLVKNPFMLFNTGFQLSYLAIFSLSVILPVVASLKQSLRVAQYLQDKRVLSLLFDIFTPIAALQIGMTPLTAYVFNYFSLGGILANIPIIFLSGFIIPLGLILMPVGALLPLASGVPQMLLQGCFDVPAFLMKLLINLMEGINTVFYQGGAFSYNVASPSIWLMCMYYGVIFYFSSELARVQFLRKQRGRLVAAAGAIIIGSCMLQAADYIKDDFHDAQFVFIDVGQGDALHVRTSSGKNILIDGGGSANYDVGKKTLMPYFLKNGVTKIDLVVATHLHMDHYKGLTELAQNIPVERFGTYEGKRSMETKITSEMAIKPEQILYLSKNQKIELDENVYLEILWPEECEPGVAANGENYTQSEEVEEDENKSSLILRVVYEGVSVLMTGDISSDGERMLTREYTCVNSLQSDILKVPHHGSKYSSSDDFISAVKPKVAVIQVGKNNYGHPAQAVIEKYVKNDIIVYRNDFSGAIGVKDIDENRFSIITMIQP